MKNILLGLAFVSAAQLFAANVEVVENKFLKKNKDGNEVVMNDKNTKVSSKVDNKSKQIEEVVLNNDEPIATVVEVVKSNERAMESKTITITQEDKTIKSLEEAKKQIDALNIKGFDKEFAKNELNEIIHTIKINK